MAYKPTVGKMSPAGSRVGSYPELKQPHVRPGLAANMVDDVIEAPLENVPTGIESDGGPTYGRGVEARLLDATMWPGDRGTGAAAGGCK